MPAPIAEPVRLLILAELEAGTETEGAIAVRHGVGRSTVARLKKLWKETGSVTPRNHRRRGRVPVLGPAQQDLIRQIVQEDPDIRRDDLRKRLQKRLKTPVSRTGLGRTLARMNLHKRALRKAAGPTAPSTAETPKTANFRYTDTHRPKPPPLPHRPAYPSDLREEEWAILRPLVGETLQSETGQKFDTRLVINTLRYQARTGCQWRYLPHDLVPYRRAQEFLARFTREGIWERITDALREKARIKAGRAAQPTAAIADSQSVKTAKKGGSAATTEQRRSRG